MFCSQTLWVDLCVRVCQGGGERQRRLLGVVFV